MCTTFKLCNHQSNSKAHSLGLITRIKILFIFITCYVKISLIHTQYISIIFFITGNFTCLEVIFKFRRRLGYYLFHTYIPTCLIVMMSWISFWIKPEAVPARVTLGVTSLLTLSTQHANSQKSLPPVSYIKVCIV